MATILYPATPLVGIDIGGSLAKLVLFEPTDPAQSAIMTENDKYICDYILSKTVYATNGVRDTDLCMKAVELGGHVGNLHFIRLLVTDIDDFLAEFQETRPEHPSTSVACLTGAIDKFSETLKNGLNLVLKSRTEFDCLVKGIHYTRLYNPIETSHWIRDENGELCQTQYNEVLTYPLIVTNAGTGASVNLVKSPQDYNLIGGTSLCGGSFWGLSCLLTGCETYDEAMALAEAGDNTNVDKVCGDIFGAAFVGYPITQVASNFGKMNSEDARAKAKKEDLARSVLWIVTDIIGRVSRLHADVQGARTVIFTGNFLHNNHISMKHLTTDFELFGIKVLFLEHDGYFGAIGALLECAGL